MEEVPSVSDIVLKIKHLLEGEYRTLSVLGEISNLSYSSSGHWYFTLSDKNSSLSISLFKTDAFRNPLIKKLKNGDKIICTGSIGVYVKRGTFQLIAKRISPAGKGDLKEDFEKLKLKLGGEGLFDLERKRSIPNNPKRIGIITAKKSAALQDFLSIMERRSLWFDLLIADALVQGEKAPASIKGALFNLIEYSLKAEKSKKLDLIVITRGGGSMEDLWGFNDEGLAWDIFNSPIPVISAVGHEVDYTICDLVSDLRVETPTAAAERLSSNQADLISSVKRSRKALLGVMKNHMNELNLKLKNGHPQSMIEIFWGKISYYQKRLNELNPEGHSSRYLNIFERSIYVDDMMKKMSLSMKNLLQGFQERTVKSYEMLRVLDPQNILKRGYSLIKDDNHKVISNAGSFDSLTKGEILNITFHDGKRQLVKKDHDESTEAP